jgi:hypothetical protein
MTNILTTTQAANALRTTTDDPRMLDLLPQIDGFIQRATGRDWTQDTTKDPAAIAAATILLVMWFENPAMTGSEAVMPFGLTAALTQLEAQALKYRHIQFRGRKGAGAVQLDRHHGAGGLYVENWEAWAGYEVIQPLWHLESPRIKRVFVGDVVQKLVGVYGVSGTQASSFEAVISVKGQIQQLSTDDLSQHIYVVILKSPQDDVSA